MTTTGSACSRRLVLVPYPIQGHLNPMLQLATILHSKGFPVLIALPHPLFNFPITSSDPDFTFHLLSERQPEASDEGTAASANLALKSKAPFQDLLTQIIDKEEHPCIIYDGIMNFAESVADKMKLPSIVLRTSSAANLHSYHAYPRLHNEGHLPAKDSRSHELVPGLKPLRFKDLCVSDFKDFNLLMQFIAKILNTGSSSAMILNSMDCLASSSLSEIYHQSQVPIFPIGPIHLMVPKASVSLLGEDSSCIAWLDKQTENSVIYVSFGSSVSIAEEELSEMAWGLANSKQPFLWVIRPGSVHGQVNGELPIPDNFRKYTGERGCIVKWAPQKEVLAHKAVGGFWSHCGWNSTIESISKGIPMICTPFRFDQRVNTRYLSHVWGVGFELENGSKRGAIEKTVKRLMVDEEGEELRQRAADLKAKADISVREGGYSYNSLNNVSCVPRRNSISSISGYHLNNSDQRVK